MKNKRPKTWEELQEWAKLNNIQPDTLLLVSGSDHSYNIPYIGLADARVYPDGDISEDHGYDDDDDGKSVKGILFG